MLQLCCYGVTMSAAVMKHCPVSFASVGNLKLGFVRFDQTVTGMACCYCDHFNSLAEMV